MSPAQPALSAIGVGAAAQQTRWWVYCGVLRTQRGLWGAGPAESYHAMMTCNHACTATDKVLPSSLHAAHNRTSLLSTCDDVPTFTTQTCDCQMHWPASWSEHTTSPAETSVLPSLLKAAARAVPFILRLPTLLLLFKLTSPMWPLSPRKANSG